MAGLTAARGPQRQGWLVQVAGEREDWNRTGMLRYATPEGLKTLRSWSDDGRGGCFRKPEFNHPSDLALSRAWCVRSFMDGAGFELSFDR